jgi:hypothetical protein
MAGDDELIHRKEYSWTSLTYIGGVEKRVAERTTICYLLSEGMRNYMSKCIGKRKGKI